MYPNIFTKILKKKCTVSFTTIKNSNNIKSYRM